MDGPKSLFWPITGTLAIVVLSAGLEIVLGNPLYYMLPFPLLLALFWSLTRLSRTEVGLTLGPARAYAIAVGLPFLAMALVAATAWASGHLDPDPEKMANLPRLGRNFLLNAVVGVLAVLLTEEGYFRGWLWGSVTRAGLGTRSALLWTSAAFALWHLPVPIIEKDFALPASVIPVYLTNVVLLGLQWGLLRLASGSVVVPSICHSVWNALAYSLFGYGTKTGALGLTRYDLLGPERGLLGIVLNAVVVALLWRWASRSESTA